MTDQNNENTAPTPLEQIHEAQDAAAVSDTKSPLERVRETQNRNQENLKVARGEQAIEVKTEDVEQRRVDRTTETPGSIGGSGQAPNPAHHPTRQMG